MTKEEKLFSLLADIGKDGVTVAFSGGVDSTYLLWAAQKTLGTAKVSAVFVSNGLTAPNEAEDARKAAEKTGVSFQNIQTDVLNTVRFNPVNRCYLCKKQIFATLAALGRPVIDGTNADDITAYRPGIKALKELGIHSPLAQAGLTKAEIRHLAHTAALPESVKPSSPCLATRLPYGDKITSDALRQIGAAEAYLKQNGFAVVRVRKHQNIARIELLPTDFTAFLEKSAIHAAHLKTLGFDYVTLDIDGFKSGKMDLHLTH